MMASNSGSTWTVATYLVSIGVDESDAGSAAERLLNAGYKTETYLLSATRESLREAKVSLPVIDVLLKKQLETHGEKYFVSH